MIFPRRRRHNDKIFINYRRGDAGGFAGRLADTLGAHFGGDRVFRDVTGIEYGHDFEKVIDERVSESCALVVLIGDKWTTIANEDGVRRLDVPGDYVCREIAAALDTGVAVVPVLIGDAAMPRREELPPALAGLIRRNAMTITDERWDHDVARLAKVLAIDVPGSVAQRRLDLIKKVAVALLAFSALASILAFCLAVGRLLPAGQELREAGFPPILSALPFIAAMIAGTLVLTGAPAMEAVKRRYVWGLVLLVALGTLASFVYYTLNNVQLPAWSLVVNFGASLAIILGMLALMVVAGFREK